MKTGIHNISIIKYLACLDSCLRVCPIMLKALREASSQRKLGSSKLLINKSLSGFQLPLEWCVARFTLLSDRLLRRNDRFSILNISKVSGRFKPHHQVFLSEYNNNLTQALMPAPLYQLKIINDSIIIRLWAFAGNLCAKTRHLPLATCNLLVTIN
ncbi:hypothetical protein K9N50_02010 [bacterium]|nr:hypothetical protein [bacterium]